MCASLYLQMTVEKETWDDSNITTKTCITSCALLVQNTYLFLLFNLFSSGIWRLMTCRASEHWILHPWQSSGRSTIASNRRSGTLVHETGLRCWTWILGGHWGVALLLWLRSKPAESGITFWIERKTITGNGPTNQQIFIKNKTG